MTDEELTDDELTDGEIEEAARLGEVDEADLAELDLDLVRKQFEQLVSEGNNMGTVDQMYARSMRVQPDVLEANQETILRAIRNTLAAKKADGITVDTEDISPPLRGRKRRGPAMGIHGM